MLIRLVRWELLPHDVVNLISVEDEKMVLNKDFFAVEIGVFRLGIKIGALYVSGRVRWGDEI